MSSQDRRALVSLQLNAEKFSRQAEVSAVIFWQNKDCLQHAGRKIFQCGCSDTFLCLENSSQHTGTYWAYTILIFNFVMKKKIHCDKKKNLTQLPTNRVMLKRLGWSITNCLASNKGRSAFILIRNYRSPTELRWDYWYLENTGWLWLKETVADPTTATAAAASRCR